MKVDMSLQNLQPLKNTKEYYKQLCAKKFSNLDKMDDFFKKTVCQN